MTLGERLDVLARGWRGPVLAALVALAATLPGLLALPPIDRDEARFAEASAQMLESGDFIDIRFQRTPRDKKPVGIYWLQAAATRVLSPNDDRRIWTYRVPSLVGAMVAAAACVWGAAAFLRPGAALAAGAMLASSFMLSTEAMIASTDAALAGAVTAAMAALARIWISQSGEESERRRPDAWTRFVFWLALGVSILLKGPIGPMVVILAAALLSVWSRQVRWLRPISWVWGLLLLAVLIGPWAMAITVSTDGAFWGKAVGGDLAPKLIGGQEGHGAPPGYYLVLAPLLIFPATLLLPGGLLAAWRSRLEPGVRFAICWLVPSWIVFEAVPTKLIHYTLPLYGALAWLMARALSEPMSRGARIAGAVLAILAGLLIAALGPAALANLSFPPPWPWAAAAASLALAAALAGAVLLLRGRPLAGLGASILLAVVGHDVLGVGLVPRLAPLWLSQRAAETLAAEG
ncbi:MAG: ArnT family glycosyltransferase, partial [Caulobacteraceae bacterium]